MACPTADDAAVQTMLDNTAAAGGGIVQLEPRVYSTCTPWIIGSNTHLRGAGRGATIVRGSAEITGKTVANAHVLSSIATVGTRNVRVSDLTVDHATCERNANGISLLPEGESPGDIEAYDGAPTTNAIVERVEVLGSPSYHSYMIWNLRGRHIKILDNWVDGRASTKSNQEGIESYGGADVLIAGNTVRNIGFACLNVGSAGISNSEPFAVTMANNFLENCHIGVNLGTSNGPNGPIQQSQTRVLGNVITGARRAGIDVAVVAGSTERDLLISSNTIRDINVSGGVGISMRAVDSQLDDSAVVSNSIHGNHIENIRGANAHGIRIWSYPNVRVIDNTVVGVDNGAVYAVNANNVEIAGNRIEEGGVAAIQLWGTSESGTQKFSIDRNRIGWSGTSSAILVVGGKRGTIRDNIVTRTDADETSPVTLAGTCGVTITGNVTWYSTSWAGATTPPCE